MASEEKIKVLLSNVFDDAREGLHGSASYDRQKHEFVFHMSDWLFDLEELVRLYKHAEKANRHDACVAVMGFLYHVIPHLKAAGRLLLDEIPDAFDPSVGNESNKASKPTSARRRARAGGKA